MGGRSVHAQYWRNATILYVVGLTCSSACADTTRTVIQRQDVSRELYSLPGAVREHLDVRRERQTVIARVQRTQAQTMMARVSGYEIVATTNTMPTWATVLGVSGLLAAGIGVLLAVPASGSDGSTSSSSSIVGSQPILGWSLVGVGSVLTMPFLFTWLQLGTTSEQRPFERREAASQPAPTAAPEPVSGVPVTLAHAGTDLRQETTDVRGEARFDLGSALPEHALYGTVSWPSVDVLARSLRMSLQLAPLRQEVADQSWSDIERRPARAAISLFRQRFPNDPRVNELGALEATLDQRERRSSNREAWGELPGSLESVQTFAQREPVDVFVAEARCRLAIMVQDAGSRASHLSRCRAALDSTFPSSEPLEAELYQRAMRSRDEAARLAEPAPNLAASDRSLPDEQPRRHGRHSRRSGTHPPSDLEARVQQQIASCRAGSRDASGARRAYNVLMVMRQQGQGNRVGALLVQVNLACSTTPSAVGINGL